MEYLVLARKYRPQSFDDMTGQEHVVQTLGNAMKMNRVAHALLFCGPRGCGKTTTARIVAKALNCVNGPTPNPCGTCAPCREITAGADVDVQEIDAASNTGVDNVRELRESAKYMPARDRFKIFIVDEVHMLSKAAFNAFLKTLEEPPGHVKFLFATTDPQALPETILSRVQRHNFRLVPLKLLVERLRNISRAENIQIDDGALTLVARQAAGSVRDSLSILDQLFSSCPSPITEQDAARALGALDRNVVADLASSLLARDAKGVIDGVARAYDGGHDLKRLADDLAAHLRNLVAAGLSGTSLDLPDHEVKALQTQAARADPSELVRLFDLVQHALPEVSRATHPRHALEAALLRAVFLAPSTGIQSLLSRAEELSKRLGGDPSGGRGGGGGGGGSAAPSSGGGGSNIPRPNFGSRAAPEPVAAPVVAAPPPPPPAPVVAPAPVPVPQVAAPPPVPVPQVAAPPPVPRVEPPKPPTAGVAVAKPSNALPWGRHLGGETPPAQAPVAPAPTSAYTPPAPVAAAPAPPAAAAPVVVAPVPAPSPAVPAGTDASWPIGWVDWIEAVRAKKPRLASAMEHARPLSFANGELKVAFERNALHGRSVIDEKALVEGILTEVTGQAVRLALVETGPGESNGVQTLAERLSAADATAKANRLKLGREHPAIVSAAAILGAEIEEVRDLYGANA